jgi:hypothetical protein
MHHAGRSSLQLNFPTGEQLRARKTASNCTKAPKTEEYLNQNGRIVFLQCHERPKRVKYSPDPHDTR